jgi:phage protein U
MHFLGDITLTGFSQPGTLDTTSEAIYAEHPKLQGKPALQRTGSKNAVVSMVFNVHRSTTIPENFIQQLQDAQDAGTILPLTTEAGDLLGDFVITQMQISRQASDAVGSIIAATVSVSLIEWASVDGVAERQYAARQQGFAVGVTGQTNPQLTQAVEFQAMESALATGSGAQAIDTTLSQVAAAPALEDQARRKIKVSLTTLLSDANTARTIINGFGGQKYTDTRGMETDLLAVIASATTMKNAVDTATLTDLRTMLTTVSGLIATMRNSAEILAKYAGTRS